MAVTSSPSISMLCCLAAVLLSFAALALSNPLPTDVSPDNPMEVQGLIEGDMVPDDDGGIPRNAVRAFYKRWPKGEIPYTIDSSFNDNEKAKILNAMEEYHEKTCVKFVPKINTHWAYIKIIKGNGCWSKVGRVYIFIRQELSLGSGCVNHRTILHELMHAAGFRHEQARTDRDEFVTIRYENIKNGQEHNFKKYSEREIDPLGEQYDYDSVLHYHSKAFSKNGRETITPNRPGVTIGKIPNLSPTDVRKLKKMYCGMDINTTED